jgi:hypothetical protein
VCRVSGPGNLSLEPVVLVSAVVDGTSGAVRFQQGVVSGDFIAFTFLSLFLDVMCVFILHSVFEFVTGRSLQKTREVIILHIKCKLCMYVCGNVCMYVCIYVCMYVRGNVCMYLCMYVCVCVYVCMCVYVCVCVCVCI